MNKRSTPQRGSVDELQLELFEKRVLAISKGLAYPRTPDIAGTVMRRLRASTYPRPLSRRLAWSLVVVLVLFSTLMLIPPARAAILEFIQIGVVRIFPAEPTPAPPGAPPQQEIPATTIPATATPAATTEPLIPVLRNVAGELTLEEAQQRVDYPIVLPTYPADLGEPDYVFVQDADGDMTILVWTDPQDLEDVLMSLHLVPAGSWAIEKVSPTVIQETRVHGQRAIWAIGPYPIRYSNGNIDFIRMINGHVLIWAEGAITYRLETALTLEEAVRAAESLEAIP
jgi:hypothetical protein